MDAVCLGSPERSAQLVNGLKSQHTYPVCQQSAPRTAAAKFTHLRGIPGMSVCHPRALLRVVSGHLSRVMGYVQRLW